MYAYYYNGYYNNAPIRPIVQLRMVITSEAAGIIIGKRGENITQLKDECQCHIHISPKPSVNEFSERILQIEGKHVTKP